MAVTIVKDTSCSEAGAEWRTARQAGRVVQRGGHQRAHFRANDADASIITNTYAADHTQKGSTRSVRAERIGGGEPIGLRPAGFMSEGIVAALVEQLNLRITAFARRS
jgi:hypothetical protein